MPQVIKCPSCSAPLEFEGAMIEKCAFCGSQVIVSPNDIHTEASFGFDSLLGKAQKLKEILHLARSGRKIEAIKAYREAFGVGLAEAKDAVERLGRGESINFQNVDFQSFEPIKVNSDAIVKTAKVIGGVTLASIVFGLIVAVIGIGIAIYAVISVRSKLMTISAPLTSKPTATPKPSPGAKSSYATEVLRFGGEGTGAGYFKDNRSIAVDGDGRIYTADYTGGRIQVFDKDGKFLTQWMVDEESPLRDLAADRKGNVFILQKSIIQKFEGTTGKLLDKTSTGDYDDLAVSPEGKIVAAAVGTIYWFDNDLKQIAVWKDAAKQAGLTNGKSQVVSIVNGISKIAVNGLGEVYALGNRGRDVCKFTRDGVFVDRFKTKSGSAEDIAIDGKNRILVSDVNEVYVYNPDGNFADSFETRQTFGLIFNDAGELITASRPFVVKYKLKD